MLLSSPPTSIRRYRRMISSLSGRRPSIVSYAVTTSPSVTRRSRPSSGDVRSGRRNDAYDTWSPSTGRGSNRAATPVPFAPVVTHPRESPGARRQHEPGQSPATMFSYAQNAEDVVLRRTFSGVEDGFYVDVGASSPVEDSVTLHFYERGWNGV